MVDRASVDRTLYNTDINTAASILGFQDAVNNSENYSHKKEDNDALVQKKRVFEFTSREELGRFPIHLKGLLMLSLSLSLSLFSI